MSKTLKIPGRPGVGASAPGAEGHRMALVSIYIKRDLCPERRGLAACAHGVGGLEEGLGKGDSGWNRHQKQRTL